MGPTSGRLGANFGPTSAHTNIGTCDHSYWPTVNPAGHVAEAGDNVKRLAEPESNSHKEGAHTNHRASNHGDGCLGVDALVTLSLLEHFTRTLQQLVVGFKRLGSDLGQKLCYLSSTPLWIPNLRSTSRRLCLDFGLRGNQLGATLA